MVLDYIFFLVDLANFFTHPLSSLLGQGKKKKMVQWEFFWNKFRKVFQKVFRKVFWKVFLGRLYNFFCWLIQPKKNTHPPIHSLGWDFFLLSKFIFWEQISRKTFRNTFQKNFLKRFSIKFFGKFFHKVLLKSFSGKQFGNLFSKSIFGKFLRIFFYKYNKITLTLPNKQGGWVK